MTALPQPANVSQKVPIASAVYFFAFIPCIPIIVMHLPGNHRNRAPDHARMSLNQLSGGGNMAKICDDPGEEKGHPQ